MRKTRALGHGWLHGGLQAAKQLIWSRSDRVRPRHACAGNDASHLFGGLVAVRAIVSVAMADRLSDPGGSGIHDRSNAAADRQERKRGGNDQDENGSSNTHECAPRERPVGSSHPEHRIESTSSAATSLIEIKRTDAGLQLGTTSTGSSHQARGGSASRQALADRSAAAPSAVYDLRDRLVSAGR